MSQRTHAPTPKPWIDAIHAYVPGKSKAEGGKPLIKLSANENPLGTSQAAIDALEQLGGSRNLYPDPDSRALREAIAAVEALDIDHIICGTGSGELLGLAAQAYAGPGDEVLYMRYGFSLYEIVARRCGAEPVEAPDRDYATDIDALLAAVTERTRVVFLANPNNPTGTLSTKAEVSRLHEALPPSVLLVLDHAYAEYLGGDEEDGGLELSRRATNVLVTRTFSKIFGLAGERVGWATGHPDIISALNRIRGPFNTTSAAQAMAAAAMRDAQFVEEARAHNRKWRAWLSEELAALSNHGLRVVPSHANFVLVLFEGERDAAGAQQALADAGYAVRHLPGQGLPHALRITIGTEEDNHAVVRAMRAYLSA
ncbi:MAG: histidinol-phosphate transaminase [Sphingorhabdus sp.]|nr:histidinol-phosphate transaminase [Sphingorhabdus sp.]|tara:strand:+ start:573 stop:1679 length:1107 start_codon:yes stop_codon:yes gene_type:complete